jgi:hypothetical protein
MRRRVKDISSYVLADFTAAETTEKEHTVGISIVRGEQDRGGLELRKSSDNTGLRM